MPVALILRSIIVALSFAGIAYTSVAVALSLIPPFYFFALSWFSCVTGLVAIADI